jgi:hypothetical protein
MHDTPSPAHTQDTPLKQWSDVEDWHASVAEHLQLPAWQLGFIVPEHAG